MTVDDITQRFKHLGPFLDERQKRLFAAAEALAMGRGGITAASKACGISRVTVTAGCKELNSPSAHESEFSPDHRIRRKGGGRKKTIDTDPTLKGDLESLIEPTTRGDPESPLRWTAKSLRNLSDELNNMGHQTSHRMIAELLKEMGYSLQGNKKTKEGSNSPDRNEQFENIYRLIKNFQRTGDPVISVDTKKKELVGDFKNGGKELRPKGKPEEVRVHDFKIKELGKVSPYGVYDQTLNKGWVNVGIDHDTSAFAVESIRRWWNMMGKDSYPNAKRILITADGAGSNGSRVRLWKVELQLLANELNIQIHVSHFPPGTSKWNAIEHKLFSYISQNWRGKPLVSHEVIISLISATKTKGGLKAQCMLDENEYPTGIKVSDAEMQQINLRRKNFRGDWNYEIKPTKP
jgi:hypothetical protein